MKIQNLLAAVTVASLGAGSAAAVTVESTSFIASPTLFNGFEGINSDPNFSAPYFFPANTAYSEGGITVEYGARPRCGCSISMRAIMVGIRTAAALATPRSR